MTETDRWHAACGRALDEENTIDVDTFTHADAWALGSWMVMTARGAGW